MKEFWKISMLILRISIPMSYRYKLLRLSLCSVIIFSCHVLWQCVVVCCMLTVCRTIPWRLYPESISVMCTPLTYFWRNYIRVSRSVFMRPGLVLLRGRMSCFNHPPRTPFRPLLTPVTFIPIIDNDQNISPLPAEINYEYFNNAIACLTW